MTARPESRPLSVAILSCAELPEPDHDERPTHAAFAARGHRSETIAWSATDPADLARFDACIVRATWDYYHDLDRFLAWIDAAAEHVHLLNPPPAIRWNHHKGYLLELERAGVAVVPTRLLRRGAIRDLGPALEESIFGGGVMVKPAVGAGSWNARRFESGPAAAAAARGFAAGLLARCDVLLQPIVPGYADPGERSLVWIGGQWTHAVRKRPRYDGEDESVIADGPITAAERAFGDRVMAAIGGGAADSRGWASHLVQARVDVVPAAGVPGVPGDDGPAEGLLLSELELIEPSLFFVCEGGRPAAAALVRAVEQRMTTPGG